MKDLSFRAARALPCAGCFSFVTDTGTRMTAIVPSFQAFDERLFVAAEAVQFDSTAGFFPVLTVAVYL